MFLLQICPNLGRWFSFIHLTAESRKAFDVLGQIYNVLRHDLRYVIPFMLLVNELFIDQIVLHVLMLPYVKKLFLALPFMHLSHF